MHAVILDIDGTLLLSDETDGELYIAAIRHVLGEVTLRPEWHLYPHVTDAGILEDVLRDNGLPVARETIAAVRDHFVASVGRHVAQHGAFHEVPGARQFVLELAASRTHRVAYATGGWLGSAWLKLAAAGFPLRGVPLASADDHADRTAIMRHALQQLGTEFESVTYYGDGPWDQRAAERLGWHFVAVGTRLNGLTSFNARDPVR